MLSLYRTIDGSIIKTDVIEKGCWINMVKPTSDEIAMVVKTIDVDADLIRAALDPEESPRIDREGDQVLVIVDIPRVELGEQDAADKSTQIYATIPMGIVICPDYVITVCLHDTSITRDIAQCKVRDIRTDLKARFVFQILLRIAGRYLIYLRRIERSFTRIERSLYRSLKNEELIQLLGLSKSLVYFSASLKSNEVTMQKVFRGKILRVYEDDQDILEDALIEIRQAIEMANIYSSILSGTMDAYASVVSNNLNIIMKVLTVITIVLTIPNIVFSFYGMNVEWLPLAQYWFPIVLSIAISIVAWIILKTKKMY